MLNANYNIRFSFSYNIFILDKNKNKILLTNIVIDKTKIIEQKLKKYSYIMEIRVGVGWGMQNQTPSH